MNCKSFSMTCWKPCTRHPVSGLAAVQVGQPIRAFIVDCAKRSDDEEESESDDPQREEDEVEEEFRDPIFLINPEIVSFSDERTVYEEGCLSIQIILQMLNALLPVRFAIGIGMVKSNYSKPTDCGPPAFNMNTTI